MSGQEKLPQELQALEAGLASLRPSSGRLDRERLMFLAGRASAAGLGMQRGRLGSVLRQVAAMAAAALVAAGLTHWLKQPQTQVVERIVYVPVAPAQQQAPRSVAEKAVASEPATAVSPRTLDASYLRELERLSAQQAAEGAGWPAHGGKDLSGSAHRRRTNPPAEAIAPALSRRALNTLLEELSAERG